MNDQDMTVVCESCSEEYLLSAGLKERKVEGLRDVTEIGILCPFCELWQHSYFMNDRLRKMVEALGRVKRDFAEGRTDHRLRKMEAKIKAYRKAHAAFNRRMRKRLGVQGPAVETAVLEGEKGDE